MTPTETRLRLLATAFHPLPLFGKRPAFDNWPQKSDTNADEIRMWPKQWADATNTGILCRFVPTLDIDILHPEAVEAIRELVVDRFADHGYVLTRIGKPPKIAIPFRTDAPFKKITVNFAGTDEKVEFLCDGQQVVVDGIHPDTQKPYSWFGGAPGEIARDDLPYISIEAAQQLVDDAAELIAQFGFKRIGGQKKSEGNGADAPGAAWADLIGNLAAGRDLHNSLVRLSAKYIASGMADGAAVNAIRGHMDAAPGSVARDDRWNARYQDIPRIVHYARDTAKQPEPEPPPTAGAEQQRESEPRAPLVPPVDLWGVFSPPALPTGLLPKAIEDYVRVQAAIMGADPSGLAAGVLVVCAAAIKDSISVQVKDRSQGWTEEARIWVGLIGDPSTKKSPIIREVARPLVKIDIELFRKFLDAMARYNALDKDDKKGAEPPPQVRVRLEDTTIEAAQEVLKDTLGGVLLLQDELSGFFGSMDKYNTHRGAAKDRGFWLQAWNGGSYAINRIGRGPGLIPNLSVSLLGGIQPDLIRKLAADAHDDGMLQRMFPIVLRPATLGSDEPIPAEADDYARVIDKLYQLTPNSISFWGSGGSQARLTFDAAAQAIRQDLERKHLALAKLETINKKLAAHIGKYDGLFARLCVIWHCVENCFDREVPRLISARTAQRVADFLHKFLLPHAVAFYGNILGLADDHDRLVAVAGYILARKLDRVTNRDVARGDRTMRRLTKRETDEAFEQLEALGWVARQRAKRPSDPPHWAVNPECHRLFAQRGQMEQARRAEARELIRELLT